MGESLRLGIAQVAKGNDGVYQESRFADDVAPEWVEIDASRVRVERVLDFGAYLLGLQTMQDSVKFGSTVRMTSIRTISL